MRRTRTCLIAMSLLLLGLGMLTACGGNDTAAKRVSVNGQADETLPTPEGTPGSAVTAMPATPGPGPVEAPSELPVAVALDENGNPLPAPELPVDPATLPADASTETAAPAPAIAIEEPSAQDAVALVRDYYAAINARSYAHAYALWSDGGRSSGQSPQQFADGFAQTSGVSVEIMAPGRVSAAAGSRYVEVPVALTATRADGSQHKYVGAYTLRRAVVDGASPEQRAWRIGSADLREVRP